MRRPWLSSMSASVQLEIARLDEARMSALRAYEAAQRVATPNVLQ